MILKEHAPFVRRTWMLLEAGLIGVSFEIARVLTGVPDSGHLMSGLAQPVLWLVVILWPVLLRATGCYRTQRVAGMAEQWRVLLTAHVPASVAMGVLFATGALGPVRGATVGVFLATALVVLGLERMAMLRLMHVARRAGRNTRRALIVGAGDRAIRFARLAAEHDEWGLRLIGHVRGEGDPDAAPPDLTLPMLGSLIDVTALLDRRVIDEVIFCVPPDRPSVRDAVRQAETRGLVVRFVSDAVGRPPGDDADWRRSLTVLTVGRTANQELGLLAKRAFDVVGAAGLLVLAAPIAAVIAVLIRLDSPGPVLFRQARVGLNGRRFVMVKFRSMRAGLEAITPELRRRNQMGGPVFKLRGDPRITRVGRWLRGSSLDELPQLWNVLRGEMSLVGPRPPLVAEAAQYTPAQRRRLAMKPGITGPWQVAGRNQLDFEAWIDLDLAYVDRWSFGTDLQILARTIPAVLSGRGAW